MSARLARTVSRVAKLLATAKGRSGARASEWWWSKYSTAGSYAVRGAAGRWGGEPGSYAVRGAAGECGRGSGWHSVTVGCPVVAAVVLHVTGRQSTWTQLRSRVNSAILRWTLL